MSNAVKRARAIGFDATQMPTIAALFPGQGSHTPGMDEPFRGTDLFERGLELLGEDPFERLAEGTRQQQPALFLCSICAWDGDPDVVAAAGHSLGEYAALVAAGALEFDDAVTLVAERGAAMADCPPGGMVASLGGDEDAVRALAAELGLTVANDNAPGQLVLSGEPAAIDAATEQLPERAKARAMRLDVSGAFHSPLMEGAADRLAAALARVEVREPASPSSPVAPRSRSPTSAASWQRTCCGRCGSARCCSRSRRTSCASTVPGVC